DNMVARHHLPLGKVAGLAAAYVGLQFLAAGLHYAQSLLFNRADVCSSDLSPVRTIMLATSDLWFRYQDEPVLKGLNLDFSLSPVTGLVGA
ncbi:hypothetical protein MJL48_28100, partial [Salmonella enterica subsp. enterica serovar Kentucky]|nr:hypothetical protein [Salmonella enterica subsp. enterica serovar Kentucky]